MTSRMLGRVTKLSLEEIINKFKWKVLLDNVIGLSLSVCHTYFVLDTIYNVLVSHYITCNPYGSRDKVPHGIRATSSLT
jgi:hypothetical protein